MYFHCPTCRKRMRAVRRSEEVFGLPSVSVEVEYECPRCGDQWTHNRERNFAFRGWRSDIEYDAAGRAIGRRVVADPSASSGLFSS